MLNKEFFDDLRDKIKNKGIDDIINDYGPKAGKLIIKQTKLEEDFNTVCVEDGIKMTPLDDEFITDEARTCALQLRDNTAKLIRTFEDKQMRLKL